MTAHLFTPDHPAEPGYRPRCRVCGTERHPAVLPVPRRPADSRTDLVTTDPKEPR